MREVWPFVAGIALYHFLDPILGDFGLWFWALLNIVIAFAFDYDDHPFDLLFSVNFWVGIALILIGIFL